MAAQCRSPRCTAERKGFRRELDSWRHRLIHCVGFESILEGLYGPGLRRDLSLFDDCEPEELVDWCVDEKCSLCSLRKEIIDCTPSGDSTQSTPTGEVISQGQFNAEKIECQAENYLNALFQKKDLPQNCDPNIPLVAQELMKKMIRQFAIEYISKSRKMYQDNGTMVDSPHGCNGIQLNQTESLLQEEQDGPLDLTVARIQEHSFQDEDGVLDLSVKRNGSELEENFKIKNHKLDANNGYFLRKMKKVTKRPKEKTALTKVLATYCLYHRQQLVLMLKLLREEQKTCSHVRCGHLHVSEQAKSSKSKKKSPAIFYSCTKEKLSNCVSLKKQTPSAKLPYLSVRLKDLRLTWPNLALGTVKLNPIKHEDLHLRSNDQVLCCINTRSKKKKLFIRCSTRYRAISCSSSLPRLKLQRVSTCLDGAMVKSDLKYLNQPASPISMNNKSCQTDRTHKTVTESSNTNDPSCDVDGKQNNLMPTENNAATQSSQDKCKIGSVHFGNLIKQLLNNSKTNHFVELLKQDTNNLENTGIQTRFRKSQQRSPKFDCSLSSSQSLELTSKLNFCDAFPKEKTGCGKDSKNSTKNMAKAVSCKKRNVCDISVMKSPENTPPESSAQANKTKLPHSKSRMHSKNVSCVKNSEPCLPEGSTFSATEIVNTQKRRSHRDSFVECNIPFKRYSKNILGKCKLCDFSHGQCSFPRNNLFCKCTIKHYSGILKNFKTNGLVGRNTTDKANAHLKVVVERLENTICPGANIAERSHNGQCETRESIASKGKILELPLDQLSVDPKTSARSSNHLFSRSAIQRNQEDSALSSISATPNSPSYRISENPYLSPIKLMFVSKIESEDGEKYSLSSVSTQFDNRDPQSLVTLRKHSNDAQKKNATSDCPGQSGNPDNSLNPQCKVITSSSPSYTFITTPNLQEETYTVRRKLLVSNRVGRYTLRNNKKSVVNRARSKNLDKEMPIKKKNDLKISIPFKATKSVTHSKMADNLRESSTTETYVAKNISSTQITIKKLSKVMVSTVTSDFTNAGLPGDCTMPLERENCKIPPRISTRLQKLRAPSSVPNLCVVNESSSEQKKTKHKTKFLSNMREKWENGKIADNLEKCQAEQNLNQKSKSGKYKFVKSRLIRNRTLSNYMTRSKKSPLFALYYGSRNTFSERCALLNKSKKHSFAKCKHYRKKLRSYKPQCKPPVKHVNRVNEDQNPCTSTEPDLQADTVEWWSTATSNETLLNHLENRYEQLAKTWVTKNNVAEDHKKTALPVWKLSSSESRSPIQMLFQKKCDMNDLATWFMQTTETQSLSIVRKANARRPRHKMNEKSSRRKTKQPSINSSISKKYLKKYRQLTESSASEEPHHVSKFVHPESFSLNISKHGRKNILNMNSLQNCRDQTKDVCVKFSCPGEILDLSEFCTTKVIKAADFTVKAMHLTKDDLKASSGLQTDQGPSPSSHAELRVRMSSKQPMTALRENKLRRSTRCRNNKLCIKDLNNFLPKSGSKETKMFCSNEVSSDGNSMCTVKSGSGLNTSFSTKYRLQVGKTFPKRRCLKTINTLKCRYEMCLRKLRGTVVKYDNCCNTSVLEESNKCMKVALQLEKKKNRIKQCPVTGKGQADYTKLQIGPLKPVGFPATRGLICKFGSYALTPIRIPLK